MLTQTMTAPGNVINVLTEAMTNPCNVITKQPHGWPGQGTAMPGAACGKVWQSKFEGKMLQTAGQIWHREQRQKTALPSAQVKLCQLPLLSMHSQGIAVRRRHSQMLHWHRVLGHHLDNVPRGQELSQGQHTSPRASLQKVVVK